MSERPEYYGGQADPHEVIKCLRGRLTPEEYRGFLVGNLIKYVMRAGRKGPARQDLLKAMTYLTWLVEAEEARDRATTGPALPGARTGPVVAPGGDEAVAALREALDQADDALVAFVNARVPDETAPFGRRHPLDGPLVAQAERAIIRSRLARDEVRELLAAGGEDDP